MMVAKPPSKETILEAKKLKRAGRRESAVGRLLSIRPETVRKIDSGHYDNRLEALQLLDELAKANAPAIEAIHRVSGIENNLVTAAEFAIALGINERLAERLRKTPPNAWQVKQKKDLLTREKEPWDQRYGVYERGDGQVLFVPNRSIEAFHRGAPFSQGSSYYNKKFLHCWPNHADWLREYVRGKPAPASVHVLSLEDREKCLTAWDYGTFSGRGPEYARWFRMGKFPFGENDAQNVLAWMKWLYGGFDVPGWVVLDNLLLHYLRSERRVATVCRVAGVSVNWFERLVNRRGTAELCDRIQQMQHKKALAEVGSSKINGRIKSRLIRFLEANTLNAAYARVAKGNPSLGITALSVRNARKQSLDRASRMGPDAEAAVLSYLDGLPKSPTGHNLRDPGVIAEGVFVPPKSMIEFREQAKDAWVNKGISELLRKRPIIEQFFLDCVVPREHPRTGERPKIVVSNGNDSQHAPFGPITAAGGDGHTGAVSAEESSRKRGRQRDPEVAARRKLVAETIAVHPNWTYGQVRDFVSQQLNIPTLTKDDVRNDLRLSKSRRQRGGKK